MQWIKSIGSVLASLLIVIGVCICSGICIGIVVYAMRMTLAVLGA